MGASFDLPELEAYLLGLSTEAGVEVERFFDFFLWEDCPSLSEPLGCSGDEGFDFFFAGEFDGERSLPSVDGRLSERRRGLLISFMISCRLEMSSCESRGSDIGWVTSMGSG